MTENAILALEDGTIFQGQSLGASGQACGEVVFNTAMTGYQEILTDPSYTRQLVTLTYPHIGNTGCNEQDNESDGVKAAGLIIRDYPIVSSSWRKTETLQEFLKKQNIVAICGIDTRKLTRILREKGAQRGAILTFNEEYSEDHAKQAIDLACSFPGMKGLDLASVVTTQTPYQWQQGSWSLDNQEWNDTPADKHVVAFDFGIKQNILRMLADRGCQVTVIPATSSAGEVLELKPDGIFLSNGPGDPEPCDYAISAIRQLLTEGIPIFGICLGHQLLALATGAKTIKMKFGHHGANHPVQDLEAGTVLITSQNHGFSVDEDSLPSHVRPTHRSLFDGSLQGIELNNAPAFGFQGHPEASPGPNDIADLFDRFVAAMDEAKSEQNVSFLRKVD